MGTTIHSDFKFRPGPSYLARLLTGHCSSTRGMGISAAAAVGFGRLLLAAVGCGSLRNGAGASRHWLAAALNGPWPAVRSGQARVLGRSAASGGGRLPLAAAPGCCPGLLPLLLPLAAASWPCMKHGLVSCLVLRLGRIERRHLTSLGTSHVALLPSVLALGPSVRRCLCSFVLVLLRARAGFASLRGLLGFAVLCFALRAPPRRRAASCPYRARAPLAHSVLVLVLVAAPRADEVLEICCTRCRLRVCCATRTDFFLLPPGQTSFAAPRTDFHHCCASHRLLLLHPVQTSCCPQDRLPQPMRTVGRQRE